jgi:predicted NBD/HSP70 family sugar kinase
VRSPATDRAAGLAAVLDVIRCEPGITQPLLIERVGLGRSVVAQRVAELERTGLVMWDGLAPSRGGRAPRQLRLRAEAGHVLGVDITANELVVSLADLAGTVVGRRHEDIDVVDGPDAVLQVVERLGDALLDEAGARDTIRGIGIGMPEPVARDRDRGHGVQITSAWSRTTTRLQSRWGAPIWADDRVNLSALGERRANPLAAASMHTVYLGGGATIGAAIVLDGRIYRGATGVAGAIAHTAVPNAQGVVCRCGNIGCLEAVAGGAALARDGRMLAEVGQSPFLASVLSRTGRIRPVDVTAAAENNDPAARALLHRSAGALGVALAGLVNAFNPDLVLIGGGIARARAHVLAAVREGIYRNAHAAATRDLRIEPAAVDQEVAGVTGAIQFALDGVFSGRAGRG